MSRKSKFHYEIRVGTVVHAVCDSPEVATYLLNDLYHGKKVECYQMLKCFFCDDEYENEAVFVDLMSKKDYMRWFNFSRFSPYGGV